MSDIVIRGMEMPKSCESCKFCWRGVSTGTFCKINGKMISEGYASFDSRDINCPLVELPPHGRLGDLDKLASKVAGAQEQIRGKDYDPFMLLGDVLRWIGLTPTVLEATE